MLTGKTKTGFKFKIDERIGTDWRVITAISLAEHGNDSEKIKGTTDLVHMMLGDDEPRFLEHIASKNDGFVPISAVVEELVSILGSLNATKNS